MVDRLSKKQRVHYNAMSRPVDELMKALDAYCQSLTDDELEVAKGMAEALSTTNCGWSAYQARDLFKSMIAHVMWQRTKQTEEAQQSAAG